MNTTIKEKGGTFVLNKSEPIHRWYSYVEGYSSCLISAELNKLLSMNPSIKNVYDPFCGTGTTSLVASCKGIESFYSESNPFMQKVIETKINGVNKVSKQHLTGDLEKYINLVSNCVPQECYSWDGFEKFFEIEQLSKIITIKNIISDEKNDTVKDFLYIALSSIIVRVSKMIRRGDLRYATDSEYKNENVITCFVEKLREIVSDIYEYGYKLKCGTIKVSDDARDNNYTDAFDCVITSPPYLNGTNYIRNTKLELKLNDFIVSEKELPKFHSKGIVAGINNVSKRTNIDLNIPQAKKYIDMLVPVSYDDRIPKMVAGYFRDMEKVIQKLSRSVKDGGFFTMDIGDSQFAGVHIPTHQILSDMCKKYGFYLYDEEILRQRHSKNGMLLSQRLLRYRLEK